MYSLDWPNYMKYGALGCTIGHEMIHAYDNTSLLLDTTLNNQWYTDQSALKYQDKVKCFVQHYGNYYNKKLDLRVSSKLLQRFISNYNI